MRGRGRSTRKIAEIEGAEDVRLGASSTDSGKSDGDADEVSDEGGSSIMLDEALDLLTRRWERINGAQALKMLPRETKLKVVNGLLNEYVEYQEPPKLWYLRER